MISLDSERWQSLNHAYGAASDIPSLLRRLENMPASIGEDEPWFSLWSALVHQGDVYSASFAAVPHVVAAVEQNLSKASSSYFHFPAWVEICRYRKNVHVPDDLMPDYKEALDKLPRVMALMPANVWNAELLACALAAIAASKGYHSVAEANLELTPNVADEFLEWFYSR